MQDLTIQGFLLGISLPHGLRIPGGLGFPLFLLVSLVVWFAFLWLIGAFKK